MLSSLFFGLSQSLAVIGSQLPFLQGVPAGLSSNCTLCFDNSCLGSLLWKSSRTKSRWYQLYQIKISIQKNVSSVQTGVLFLGF